jgi:hypothetical protein
MRYLFVLLAFLGSPILFAQPVVATNGWTAAYATAAGVEDLTILAPYEMAHPPEYELRPSDIRAISVAPLVIYAGYEVMVDRLLEAAGSKDAIALRITTGYTVEILRSSIGSIAEVYGTQAAAVQSLMELEGFLDAWSQELRDSGLSLKSVAVNFHQVALAREVGLNVVGVFGPGPLEARQIAELTGLAPSLIVDNGHGMVSGPIAETTGAPVAVWINFPGTNDTRTLLDVLTFNRTALDQIAR